MTKKGLVCVVDDDEAVRVSIQMLIESIGHEAVGFADAASLFANPSVVVAANCIVLDVRMSGLSGIAAQEKLVASGVTAPVIFISGHGDIPMVVNAMRKGACDFLQKPFNEQALLDRIQELIEQDFAQRTIAERRAGVAARLATLTMRESEVLDLVLEGRLNKQIAEDLEISMKTVEQHRAKLMEKMAAPTLAELVSELTWYRSGK